MIMNKYTENEIKYCEGYYASAVGLTIVAVEVKYDEYTNDVWTTLIAEDKKGNRFPLEISQDPEGNGPGFLFGLPNYTVK